MKMLGKVSDMRNSHEIAILAGNSRVCLNAFDSSIEVEPQLRAFRAAMQRAVELRDPAYGLPLISVAFDHKGIFKKQFLKDGLTNSQKRRPNLSQLKKEIADVFLPFALENGISLEQIIAIHEDSARAHANHVIETGNCSKHLLHWMRASPKQNEDDFEQDLLESSDKKPTNRITCAAVTSEYFSSSTMSNSKTLEVFIENDPWSRIEVYIRGARLMQELGSNVIVRIRLVDKYGNVHG